MGPPQMRFLHFTMYTPSFHGLTTAQFLALNGAPHLLSLHLLKDIPTASSPPFPRGSLWTAPNLQSCARPELPAGWAELHAGSSPH